MSKVFILEECTFDEHNWVVYVASTLERARVEAKERGWTQDKEGFYYHITVNTKGYIKEWEVDE